MAGGRPREFDVDEALGAAMDVFRDHGYAGASLKTLTAAMNVNRPSLYAAFGDKAALFEAAVERWRELGGPLIEALHEEPDVRAAFEGLLNGLCRSFTGPSRARGCLITTCRAAGDDATPDGGRVLVETERAVLGTMQARLDRAREEGQLGPIDDRGVSDLARYFLCQVKGCSALARGGATEAELRRVVTIACGVLLAE